MDAPQTKTQIIEALHTTRENVKQMAATMPEAVFFNGTAESWSAADYLKHLILSIKPLAKAMKFPPEQISSMFGTAERPSMSYDELVERYRIRLAEGIRAEDNPPVIPINYRLPADVTAIQPYLIDTWDEANQRLISALDQWSEAELDRCLIPHPAIGTITVREMLYFTAYHNAAHGEDIRQAGRAIRH